MSNDQVTQILRAINDVRTDLRDFKKEMNERWEENNKRWEENDRLWKENAMKWNENQKVLDKINTKIERNYKGIFTVFEGYEISVENMYQENKQKIAAIQKQLKIANV